MNIKKTLLIVISIFLLIGLTGCSKTTIKSDAKKFKTEYENYNNSKVELEIDEDNIIKYASSNEIKKIIKEGTGVVFIGSPKDDKSRIAIKTLLDAADSTDLKTIYYIDSLEDIKDEINVKDTQIPIVLNILKGSITSYVINDKDKLTEDDELELYNKYLDGIHEVLEDTCDEEC